MCTGRGTGGELASPLNSKSISALPPTIVFSVNFLWNRTGTTVRRPEFIEAQGTSKVVLIYCTCAINQNNFTRSLRLNELRTPHRRSCPVPQKINRENNRWRKCGNGLRIQWTRQFAPCAPAGAHVQ